MKKLSFIMCILCIMFLSGCHTDNPITPIEEAKVSNVFKDEVVEDLIIRNHNVAYYDNIYHVYFDIYNENNNNIAYHSIVISYYNNTALIYSTEEILSSLSPNSSINISFEIDINLVNANRVEYHLKK